MENADNNTAYNSASDQNDLYSRNTNQRPMSKGTVVPGMEFRTYPPEEPKDNRTNEINKPVVGFFYSISRTGIGEYWPLHIGQNTIGNSSDCDIALYEGTVSAEHAILVVRKMKNPEKIIASISDARSTNGTMVNGESLGFSAVECTNGDIITIGESYELLLILIDVKSIGLNTSQNFICVKQSSTTQKLEQDSSFDPKPISNDPPHFYEDRQGRPGRPFPDGTMGLDGTNEQVLPGGTVGL